ncbi:hypothetical protein PN480_14555 [Dolichospermum circinale CS-1225]|uniref:Uncharacterized protein n=1 Tax=Dolichospermum circinale CS-537/01 TaxID=3021739 RepID=A0ABT5A970_9CYAN|nr:hypothetical protein [Dolichospermum circinale]MDB9458357.1 hypothetical protein [Dolichospermum circinale CS-545/17]MDB9468181.1 hypothetical protein [Dolichospermum circinale CS-539/09]MDB9470183.1 hypothetical protein [Dolichospermum circinale CS-539]MDB9487993.1 hypothetical protein [Dolichospermum circinale CS-537/01]MDB9523156.1 hypothetical protein [Dolichospermum circinale CS-1225]
MNFTSKNTLISVTDIYTTTYIRIVNGKIATIASNLEIIIPK